MRNASIDTMVRTHARMEQELSQITLGTRAYFTQVAMLKILQGRIAAAQQVK